MTAAGRNDRSIQEFATVDWMAYQGAPDGGVAGNSRISQWWTVKKLTFPRQLSILFPFSGIALEVAVFWDLEVARGHATLPLVMSMITNLTVLVVSLTISTLK